MTVFSFEGVRLVRLHVEKQACFIAIEDIVWLVLGKDGGQDSHLPVINSLRGAARDSPQMALN
jgi:hypothetical protein